MKNSENKALGKRGEETRGFGLERMKSAVMADVSKYLKACGGSCGETKGNMLTLGKRMDVEWGRFRFSNNRKNYR